MISLMQFKKVWPRILKNDFTAMEKSDIYVLDVLNEGLGTISELRCIGMKKQAQKQLID